MWEVKPTFSLPDGYELHEDTTGLYLITQDELIANFTHRATPAEIKRTDSEHFIGRVLNERLY